MSETPPNNTTELATRPSQSLDIQLIITTALEKGYDGKAMNEMLEFAKAAKAEQAKETYYAALAKFQRECPPVPRIDKGHEDRAYAKLENTVKVIAPYLEENGFSYRFQTDFLEFGPSVTCYLHHRDGHAERSTFAAPDDTSGKKQPIQARASTISYAKRYSLADVTGVTFCNEDTDGDGRRESAIATLEQRAAEAELDDISITLAFAQSEKLGWSWRNIPNTRALEYAASKEGFQHLIANLKSESQTSEPNLV